MLPGHEGAGFTGKENRCTGDFVRHADPFERRSLGSAFQDRLIISERFGEIGLDQPWCDTVGPHIIAAIFNSYIAGNLEIGGF